jgi:hypothetical protein
MALPLPERWRAPMGVIAGKTRQSQFLGLALLGFSRDLLIAENSFQSGFLERPNAQVQGRALGTAEARSGGGVPCNAQLGW